MKFVGHNPKSGLIEILELKNINGFIGVQFHPEYKSTVINPHPLFRVYKINFKNNMEQKDLI